MTNEKLIHKYNTEKFHHQHLRDWFFLNSSVKIYYLNLSVLTSSLKLYLIYSTGHSQHNTDFAKKNQNEVVRIRTNFFEDFRIRKLIPENKFVILNF